MNGFSWSRLAWLLPAVAALGMGLAIHRQHRALTAQPAVAAVPPTVVGTPLRPPEPAAPTTIPTASEEVDRVALTRLRTEIAQLRGRIEQREQALAAIVSERNRREAPVLHILRTAVPPESWRNVGADTPEHVMETLLWAGAGGDVEAMRPLLVLDDDTKTAAQALFDRLPSDLQTDYREPTDLIAWFTADAVPLMKAEIPGVFEVEPNERNVIARLRSLDDPEAKPRLIKFVARRDEAADRWQIVVPAAAVAGYAAALQASPPP